MDDKPKLEPWEKEYRNENSPAGRETGNASVFTSVFGGCGLSCLVLLGIIFCLFAVCLAISG